MMRSISIEKLQPIVIKTTIAAQQDEELTAWYEKLFSYGVIPSDMETRRSKVLQPPTIVLPITTTLPTLKMTRQPSLGTEAQSAFYMKTTLLGTVTVTTLEKTGRQISRTVIRVD